MKYFITDHSKISLGHLDQEQKNTQLTKFTNSSNVCSYNVLSKIIPFSAKETSYGDLTGPFPYMSSLGDQYVYVMYDHDSNGILVTLFKNRNASTIVDVWKILFNKLTNMVMKQKCLYWTMNSPCN